jgi:hypothetical protein
LDTLKVTASGLDDLPHWFLKLAAPNIALPLSIIFNESLNQFFVPSQWKESVITPVPKIPKPKVLQDFRPISVTPILSRLFEKVVVRKFLYPILVNDNFSPEFFDQYAFRPTGSTTSALINLVEKIGSKLSSGPFVHVLSFDMSKAFDTVRHSCLMSKLSKMQISDEVYNWLANYLYDRSHVTRYNNVISSAVNINASIVQGSAIGPICYILNSCDLKPLNSNNDFNKYADDVYLVVSSENSNTILAEVAHNGRVGES